MGISPPQLGHTFVTFFCAAPSAAAILLTGCPAPAAWTVPSAVPFSSPLVSITPFFAVLTLTERTEHFLSLRAVNYITAAVFTSKDHFTPRLLPFTTFFFVEPFYLTIDSIVFPYRKIHIIFSYRSFTMIVSCFHQVCVILRQESVIDHMAPFIPKTITVGISHFLRETDHDIKVLAPHLFHINILTVPQK